MKKFSKNALRGSTLCSHMCINNRDFSFDACLKLVYVCATCIQIILYIVQFLFLIFCLSLFMVFLAFVFIYFGFYLDLSEV